MDRTQQYRTILKNVVQDYATLGKGPVGVDSYPLIDAERDAYTVQLSGWDQDRRVHGCMIHLDLKDGKVWIQHDGTDRPVARELTNAGIPKSDIVLGFQPPDRRQYTDYAVG